MLDIVIEGVPIYADNAPLGVVDANDTGGIISFYFELNYPNWSTANEVTAATRNFLLAVNPGSSLLDAGDYSPLTATDNSW